VVEQLCSVSNEFDKATPLMFSTLANNEVNTKRIIKTVKKGKQGPAKLSTLVNTQDCLGNTVSHFATINKQLTHLKAMDSAGADFTIKNVEGKSPIDLAISEGNKDELEFLSALKKNQKFIKENKLRK